MQTFIAEEFSRLTFADPQSHANIVVLPLLKGGNGTLDYLTMSEALEQRSLIVTEIDQEGSVPDLRVTSTSEKPILLLDGEELAGAKQNRVLNTSVLLKEKADILIPVSCTEEGRWGYTSDEFTVSGHLMSSTARARKNRSVSSSLDETQQYTSDQGEVWESVAELREMSGTSSNTSAMSDTYEQRAEDIAECLKQFTPVSEQKGLMVFTNGRVVGFEFISQSSAYARLHEKLLKSYVVEALFKQTVEEKKDVLEVGKRFITRASQCEERCFESVGYGYDYRYKAVTIVGSCLAHQERVVHAAFFRLDEGAQGESMSSMSSRRRFRV